MTKAERIEAIERIIKNPPTKDLGQPAWSMFSGSYKDLATAIEEAIGVERIEVQRSLREFEQVLPVSMLIAIEESISTNKEVIKINDKRK